MGKQIKEFKLLFSPNGYDCAYKVTVMDENMNKTSTSMYINNYSLQKLLGDKTYIAKVQLEELK